MSGHILVIENDDTYDGSADEALKYSIRCPEGNGCNGWQECSEDHGAAWEGPEAPEGKDRPWAGLDEFEFHGVPHTWRNSWGWTVPFKGCIVAETVEDFGEFEHLPPGEYPVEDEWWDDTDCYLDLIDAPAGATS